MTAPGGPLRVGVLICFESAFPDMAASDADQGAQLIVYQTSDSTFQDSWALAQHAALAHCAPRRPAARPCRPR